MNISLRGFVRGLAASLFLIAAAAFNQTAFAGTPPHNLVFTELSSSLLSITYDGSTVGVSVVNNGPDSWRFSIPAAVTFSSMVPNLSWTEPDNVSLFNVVSFTSGTNTGSVASDRSPSLGPILADGSTFFFVGSDIRDAGIVQVTFFDRGDAAAIPEGGSTLAFLTMALAGLCLARKVKAKAV
jgi:hypothetical protein